MQQAIQLIDWSYTVDSSYPIPSYPIHLILWCQLQLELFWGQHKGWSRSSKHWATRCRKRKKERKRENRGNDLEGDSTHTTGFMRYLYSILHWELVRTWHCAGRGVGRSLCHIACNINCRIGGIGRYGVELEATATCSKHFTSQWRWAIPPLPPIPLLAEST